jgi:signal peptidase I
MEEESHTPHSAPHHPGEAPEHQPAPDHQDDWFRSLAEAIRTIVIVIVLAYLLRLFVFQPYIVEGASMAPYFATSDYLVVDKISYHLSAPQRGDIIVFRYPNDPSTNYVKRIIGLPGEQVVIENGGVKIINDQNPNGFTLNESSYLDDSVKTTLPAATQSTFTVTADHYFVLGDNRPASSDSREWGLLPKDNIVGRVAVKAYPLDTASVVHHARY